MGIGNRRWEAGAWTRRRRLITPHGDRKRHGHHDRSRGVAHLITPHGDRKLNIANANRLPIMPSLPLMGIGNGSDWGRAPSPPGSHYPSWGSETATRRAGGRRSGSSHYPSWGSETRLHDFVRSTETRLLITPHGDRKRRGPYRRALLYGHLITPHGDRKRALPWRFMTRTPYLITPHGDRKHVRRSAPRSPGAVSHYPSWGSETDRRRRTSITRSSLTHYPSWGSETLLERPELQGQKYQTPVHGTLKHHQAAHVTAISAVTRHSCA